MIFASNDTLYYNDTKKWILIEKEYCVRIFKIFFAIA